MKWFVQTSSIASYDRWWDGHICWDDKVIVTISVFNLLYILTINVLPNASTYNTNATDADWRISSIVWTGRKSWNLSISLTFGNSLKHIFKMPLTKLMCPYMQAQKRTYICMTSDAFQLRRKKTNGGKNLFQLAPFWSLKYF